MWAADRMWDGLIAPSDSLWEMGARAWLGSSMLPRATRDREDVGGELHGLEARLHHVGQRAIEETTPRGRAELYGEMLAACAYCHIEISTRREH